MAAGAPPMTLYLGPYNDLQNGGGYIIKNWNFHQTQLPGYAPPQNDMVDFNGIKTFLFDLEMHQNRW